MEDNGSQTVATFTGTLLRRKRMPGKPFVQLVFREAENDWLCLSSNLKHVASLQIGKKYQIEGIFKSMGEHQYIHEPNIMPIAREIKKRRVIISVAMAIGIVLAAGGIVLAATHDPSAPRQDTPPDTSAQQQTSTKDDTYTGAPAPTSDTPPADTPTTPATTPTTTPKATSTPKTSTPVVTPPPASNPSASNSSPVPPTPPPPAPPATPQDVTGSWLSDGTSVQLSWSDSDTPDHYLVYRDGKQIDTSPSAGYTDTSADPAQSHSYYVIAVNSDGQQSGQSDPETLQAYTAP